MEAGNHKALRVIALMEATTVTGPAKNLLAFATRARIPGPFFPAGVELSIVTFSRGTDSNAFIDEARKAGISVDVIHEKRAFQFSILRDLGRIVELRRPDIIQTHAVKSHFLVRFLNLPKIYTWIAFHHGYVATNIKVHAYNQINRWSLRAAQRVVAVCGPFADQLERSGIKRAGIVVRHNIIQPFSPPPRREVAELRARLAIRLGEKVILSVGRLSREKGHLDLVEAVGILQSLPEVGPFRVIIVGDGPDRPLLEKRRTSLNLNGIVEFVGHQASINVWYSIADVMVLPSHSEGSPNVLLEALAASVPTVATRVGGVPEIAVHRKNALLVPRGDWKAMANSIALLLNDSELRRNLSRAGLEVTDHFTPDAYCDFMLNLYEQSRQVCSNHENF